MEDLKLYEWVRENNCGDLLEFFVEQKSIKRIPMIFEKLIQYLIQEIAYIASGSRNIEGLKRGY